MKPKPRACGTCTACCTALAVTELDKAQDVECSHVKLHKCSIYDERPVSCRGFSCIWLRDSAGSIVSGEFRPDRCGLVLDMTTGAVGSDLPQAFVAHELWPNASRQGDGERLICTLSRHSVVIIRALDGNRRLLGPRPLVAAYQRAMLVRSV